MASQLSKSLLRDLPDAIKFVILNFLHKQEKAVVFFVNKEFSEKVLDFKAWRVFQFCSKYRISDRISERFLHNVISAYIIRINQSFETQSVQQNVFEYLAQNTVATDICLSDKIFSTDEATASQISRLLENKHQLSSLELHKMVIGHQSCTALIETLPKVPIKCLSLVGAHTLYPFLKSLGSITSLTHLSFHGSSLHGELKLLVDSLNSISSIQFLDLSNNQLDHTDMEQWAMCTNTSITSLNFDKNIIWDHGISILADWIHPNLNTLMLSYNNMSTMGANILAGVHKKFSKLILNASCNPICNMGAFALADAFRTTSQQELFLGKTHMDDLGLVSVISVLTGSSLQLLSMDHNELCDDGIPFLAHFLKNTNTLKTLDLYLNKISSKGTILLCEGIALNSSLTRLNLGNNMIGNIGARSLAEALERHPSIRAVYLESNSIGDEGAIALGNILHCANIQTLQLSHNPICEQGHIALAEGLRHSKCSNLCIWNNGFGKAPYLYLDLYRHRDNIYIDICEC